MPTAVTNQPNPFNLAGNRKNRRTYRPRHHRGHPFMETNNGHIE